jgi:hypothetical protein
MTQAKRTTDKDPGPFRVQISIGAQQISEEAIQRLALAHGRPHLADVKAKDVPEGSKERTLAQQEIREVIVETLREAASGRVAGGYELSEEPEPFFEHARTKARDGERVSQEDAIRDLLRIKEGEPIVLSELQLAEAAIRCAREQNRRPDYGMADLIREGVRMVAQSIVSKSVAATNATGPGPLNLPGQQDDFYMAALNRLRAERANPEVWFKRRRSKVISISILAREAGTNDIQIRAFLKRHGIADVYDPRAEKIEEDES